jgi:PHD/YefM family antitoxin component YafN of YafNO toxin-antitoxin module
MRMCSLQEAESGFSDLVRYVHESGSRVALIRDDKAMAILMSAEELESLEETLAVLSEASALSEIIEARHAIKADDLIPSAEVILGQKPRLPS